MFIILQLRRKCGAALIVFSLPIDPCYAGERPTPNQAVELQVQNSAALLHYFADMALLINRGLANSAMAGSTDNWILQELQNSAELREFIGASVEQLAWKDVPRKRVREDREFRISFWDNEIARDRLEKLLTYQQREKLPAIYLNIEGLMALRRDQFRILIGLTPEQQKEIVKLSNHYLEVDAPAALIYRGLFTLPKEDVHLLPKFTLELRQLSAELDHKIAMILTEEQRLKAAEIINEATQITHLVRTPGPLGQPWRASFR